MKKHPAIAIVEFSDIPTAMFATDAMLKVAPIAFIKCGTISHGRYLTLVGGTTASVEESLREGLFHGGPSVLDHLLLADIHPRVYEAMLGWRKPGSTGALKGTPVDLLEIRLADTGLSGKGISIYQGSLPDIEAAIDLAARHLGDPGSQLRSRIISSPHEALVKQIETSTWFGSQTKLDLEGETAS
jgi:microcompartment protein CcmL/EutN